MKILITTELYPPELGGSAVYSKTLKEMLPVRGFQVTVLPFSQVRKYTKILRHLMYFFLILREGRDVDIVYAQDPISVGFPSMCAAFLLHKKFVLKMVRDYAWEQAVQRFGFLGTPEEFQSAKVPLGVDVLRHLERLVARSARIVVVPSKYLGTLVHLWGVSPKKVKLVYSGVEHLGDTGNKMVLRGLIHFHGSLLISVGRLVPWEGVRGFPI
jgi:glycosyltransferase involved in cell wall biosynthesis